MEVLTTVELINVLEMYSEFSNECGQDVADALLDAEGENVEVLSEETDGYWNIRLNSGLVVDGISWYHLRKFNADTTTKQVTILVGFG